MQAIEVRENRRIRGRPLRVVLAKRLGIRSIRRLPILRANINALIGDAFDSRARVDDSTRRRISMLGQIMVVHYSAVN